MEQQLIKTLLSNSTFLTNQANLRRTLFSGEYAYIYDKIKEAHEKYALRSVSSYNSGLAR